MKMIEAVINNMKLQEVRNALADMGVVDFMEMAVSCNSDRGERVMSFRGAKFVAKVAEKVKLEIISADEKSEKIIGAIRSIMTTGRPEECRIAIRPYLEVT